MNYMWELCYKEQSKTSGKTNWDIQIGDNEIHMLTMASVSDDPVKEVKSDQKTGGGISEKVQRVLDKYKDRFDLPDTSPANVPLKAEYKNRTFYRAEPEKSVRD